MDPRKKLLPNILVLFLSRFLKGLNNMKQIIYLFLMLFIPLMTFGGNRFCKDCGHLQYHLSGKRANKPVYHIHHFFTCKEYRRTIADKAELCEDFRMMEPTLTHRIREKQLSTCEMNYKFTLMKQKPLKATLENSSPDQIQPQKIEFTYPHRHWPKTFSLVLENQNSMLIKVVCEHHRERITSQRKIGSKGPRQVVIKRKLLD